MKFKTTQKAIKQGYKNVMYKDYERELIKLNPQLKITVQIEER